VAFANQMSRSYQALIVERIVGAGPRLVSSIGLSPERRAVGPVTAPIGGVVGDRLVPARLHRGRCSSVASLATVPLAAVIPVAARRPGIPRATASSGDGLQPSGYRGPAGAPSDAQLHYPLLYAAGIVGPLSADNCWLHHPAACSGGRRQFSAERLLWPLGEHGDPDGGLREVSPASM
jgi:hypothetical protein